MMLMRRLTSWRTLVGMGAIATILLVFLALAAGSHKAQVTARHSPQVAIAGDHLGVVQESQNDNDEARKQVQQVEEKRSDDKQSPAKTSVTAASEPCSQAERLHQINEYCKKNAPLQDFIQDPRSELDIYRKFLVDKRHRILFCQVPKAAGSYWRTMLARGTGQYDENDDDFNIHRAKSLESIGLEFLHNFPAEEQREMFQTYFKVMTVRHPMERAVSAYVDKFTASRLTEPLLDCIKHANKNYRSKNNQIRLKKGIWTIPSGLTFNDFTNLVVDETSPYNPHWDSAYHLCHPCVVRYDYIIRTETIATDAGRILKLLSSELKEQLKLEIVHSQRNNTLGEVEESSSFEKVIADYGKLTSSRLQKVVDVYRHDMDMFGYDFNMTTSKATCGYDVIDGGTCC